MPRLSAQAQEISERDESLGPERPSDAVWRLNDSKSPVHGVCRVVAGIRGNRTTWNSQANAALYVRSTKRAFALSQWMTTVTAHVAVSVTTVRITTASGVSNGPKILKIT